MSTRDVQHQRTEAGAPSALGPAWLNVSGYFIRALFEVVLTRGVSPETLCGPTAASSFPVPAERRMPLDEYQRLLGRAIVLTREPALGLYCGLQARESSFGLMSPLISHTRTLREAIGLITRFRALVSDAMSIELHESLGAAQLRLNLPQSIGRAMTEQVVAGLVHMLRGFNCNGSDVHGICFYHKTPAHYSDYERVFHGAQRFGQSFTGVEFCAQVLDRPHMHWQPELQAAAHIQAERAIELLNRPQTFTERVQALLRTRPAPRLVEVARALGVSERSLRRRLEDEGTSFRELIQAAIFETARVMLRDPDQNLKSIAQTLGYSCHSSFHRAFLRWAATTPLSYRASSALKA